MQTRREFITVGGAEGISEHRADHVREDCPTLMDKLAVATSACILPCELEYTAGRTFALRMGKP
jgi:hypothetical protein